MPDKFQDAISFANRAVVLADGDGILSTESCLANAESFIFTAREAMPPRSSPAYAQAQAQLAHVEAKVAKRRGRTREVDDGELNARILQSSHGLDRTSEMIADTSRALQESSQIGVNVLTGKG